MPESVLNGDHAEVQIVECDGAETEEETVDLHFEPVISLPLVDVSTNEEEEDEMIKMRAKLYRYDSNNDPAEWKERGTGEVKLLRHKTKHTVRVVMRRDKTYKICANHFVTPWMELKPNRGSDKAWVWSVLADYADEQLKPELLAIRFANAENAIAWKEAFEKAKKIVGSECEIYAGKNNAHENQGDCDSESSEVSYSDSSDNEDQPKDKEDRETSPTKSEEGEKTKTIPQKQKDDDKKAADEVSKELEKLDVKDKEEKK